MSLDRNLSPSLLAYCLWDGSFCAKEEMKCRLVMYLYIYVVMYCITENSGPGDIWFKRHFVQYIYLHAKQSFFTAKLSSAVVLRITTIFLATTTFDHLPLTCLLWGVAQWPPAISNDHVMDPDLDHFAGPKNYVKHHVQNKQKNFSKLCSNFLEYSACSEAEILLNVKNSIFQL